MRIRSSIVDGHQFTRSRRGYAVAEVDAVMARIADTLRDYEDKTDQLEARIAAAETAAKVARTRDDADHPDTEAARRHAADIVRRAEEEVAGRRAEITALLDAARREAEELRVEAERARAEVEAERRGLAAEAETAPGSMPADDAERDAAGRDAAGRDADAIRATARLEAEELLATALAEAQRLRAEARTEADEIRATRRADLERELDAAREARDEQDRRSAEASEQATSALAAANEEREALEGRLADLRSTVDMIERQMRSLAGQITTRTGAGEGPAEDAEAAGGLQAPAEDAPLATAEPHAVHIDADSGEADPAGDDTTFDETMTYVRHHAYAEPDGSGRPPADRATIVTGESGDPPLRDDHQDPYRTVYQRAGRNLRARLRQEGQDPTQRGR